MRCRQIPAYYGLDTKQTAESFGFKLIRNAIWLARGKSFAIEFKKILEMKGKLIEVNTRFGIGNELGVRCGVDLPYVPVTHSIYPWTIYDR